MVVPTVVSPDCMWQLAQFEVLPLAAWFIVQLGAAKPPVLVLVMEWHDSHAIEVVT